MKGENKLGEGGVVMTGESGSMYGGRGVRRLERGEQQRGGDKEEGHLGWRA